MDVKVKANVNLGCYSHEETAAQTQYFLGGSTQIRTITKKKDILKKMNDKLSHRGPDGEGFFTDDYVSFSHKRLAIID